MHSFLRKRSVVALGLLAVAVVALTPAIAAAKPKPGPGAHGFRLLARTLGAMTINRVYCGLSATGEICVDSTNSSTIGGGFWPKGTPDQYVFNSGLQLAGTVDIAAGFDWAGDTTGAFFFDPKGTTQHGEQVEPIFNMTSPDDAAAVSDSSASGAALAARVPQGDANELLFYPLLRGRNSASQGDVWFLTWDGNPAQNAGRSHPLGVLVEQRGLGWNFPAGNEDILYFVYTFYNITARGNSGVYDAVRPGMREILQRQGDVFQDRNEPAFDVTIPDGGYTINSLFAAFSADMDVSEASANYSSVNVPFSLGYVYENTFSGASGWTFDPAIFGSPFFAGAGFVGVKYLKSPVDPVSGAQVGLTLFSNTINQGAFDDAQNTIQLYRYISNNISVPAGDAACNSGNPQLTKICYVNTGAPADMRFFQSSGPLTLAPGEFQSIVVAYIFAAPVAVGACTGAGTCNLTPGDPRRTSTLANLTGAGLNAIDSVAGYRGFQGDLNGNGIAEQTEYRLPVQGSLMGKALVAQSVFDFNFLLPFAPDAPEFFVVPGDGQVSVLWRPSPTETSGDPFFAVATQVTVTDTLGNVLPNALYDPNYRQLDVEGYRVYRGRVDNPNELQLLAQFDYSGTFISDFAGQVNPTPGCAPELNINNPAAPCPIIFDPVVPGTARAAHVDVPLVGPFVQVKLTGGRDALASGNAILLASDTAFTGGGAGFPELRDTGVPFVYVDRTARNNLRYFYSVTAFDVNSFQSAPSALESPRNTIPTTPTHAASNFDNAVNIVSTIEGRGVARDNSAPDPQINPVTGTFSGPFPAANGWTIGLGEVVSQILVGDAEVTAHLDSLQLGSPYTSAVILSPTPHVYWFTASASGTTVSLSIPLTQGEEIGVIEGAAGFQAVQVSNSLAGQFGGSNAYRLPAQVTMSLPGPDYLALYGRGCVNGRAGYPSIDPPAPNVGACAYNGSRWFAGPSPQFNETQADPIGGNTGNFSGAPMTNYNNAGLLPGVTTIYQTQCYQSAGGAACRPLAGIQSGAKRAADFNVHWGAGGVVDSVIDATHNVPVPFDATHAAGTWGILNPAAAVATSPDGSATLTNMDFACVEPFRTYQPGGFLCPAGTPAYTLSSTAVPGTIGFFSGGAYPPAVPIDPAGAAGFAMYIAGDMFTFELTGGVLPAAGTVWSLRQYVGAIVGGNGAGGNLGPYTFSNPEGIRPLTAVGVDLKSSLSIANQVAAASVNDLRQVHTVPDPYYVTNQFEQTTDTKIIKFVNLPNDCIIRIYSSSGVLVTLLEHHSNSFGGSEDWNVRNRNNQVVASGVYFYHIEAGGARRVGRFTVVNFAE
jgi:hypothetical protein